MANFAKIVAFVVAITCMNPNTVLCAGQLSCKNAQGKDVDWFVLYKLPKTKDNKNGYIPLNGSEMLYYDSITKKGVWNLLLSDIYRPERNPVRETLAPIFGRKADRNVAYAIYNDQPPPKITNKTRGGHTKGILMALNGAKGGVVWLQHSVPRFVQSLEGDYKYPNSGRENGQLFMCTSFHLSSVNTIAKHLQIQAANVYMNNTPSWAQKFPEFWHIINKNYIRDPKLLRVDFLTTWRKRLVLAIAKSPNWKTDIYIDELRKHMNDSIIVQSWRNGAGKAQDKFCSNKYNVNDVDSIGIHTPRGYTEFSTREDHSKWYVTRHHGVFCFSTLNRMLSQMKRGGEITCIVDITLAQLFKKIIAKRTWCNKDRRE